MHRLLLALIMPLFLLACASESDRRERELNEMARLAGDGIKRLEGHLNAGRIHNTQVLETYARQVKQQRPELAELVNAISKDAGTEGPIFQGLKLRYSDALAELPSAIGSDTLALEVGGELSAIREATKSHMYGQMLADPVNVLADLSQGTLPRVDALSQEAEAAIDGVTGLGAGSQLVGNPHYGSWQQGTGGNSFWVWYGQYALLSRLFDRRIGYDEWGSRRPYSYYHDYGRHTYSSRTEKKYQQKMDQQTRERFKTKGKRYESPYAKKRATSATVSARQARTSSTGSSGASYNSSYTKKNTGSYKSSYAKPKTTGSSRNASYSFSRSSFGGK